MAALALPSHPRRARATGALNASGVSTPTKLRPVRLASASAANLSICVIMKGNLHDATQQYCPRRADRFGRARS